MVRAPLACAVGDLATNATARLAPRGRPTNGEPGARVRELGELSLASRQATGPPYGFGGAKRYTPITLVKACLIFPSLQRADGHAKVGRHAGQTRPTMTFSLRIACGDLVRIRLAIEHEAVETDFSRS